MKKHAAESFGTFWLVLGGCGSAVLSASFPGIGIGLCLTLIHLASIPVTNTSVSPAPSTGVALFAGGWAISLVMAVLVSAGFRRIARRSSLQVHRQSGIIIFH